MSLQRKHASVSLDPKPVSAAAMGNTSQPSAVSFATQAKWKATDIRQEKLTSCLVDYIAQDLLPLSTVESGAFRKLMAVAEPCYTTPSRKHLSYKLLPEKAEEVMTAVKTEMESAEQVCVTIDIWSSRDMRSFLGVTAHYILDNTLHKAMLSCKRFRGAHTADRIYSVYQDIVAAYNLSGRVWRIVTDNASNMIKAFSLPGMESLEADSEDGEGECSAVESPEHMEYLPVERVSCFAHTLQLVIKDGLKEAGQIRTVLAKASRFVSHCRRSTKATEILESCLKLSAANATRWNSQLKMIRSLLRVPENVMQELDFNDKLSVPETKLLEELCEVLQPFEEATSAVEGDNIVTASMVIICVRGLKHQLTGLKEERGSRLLSKLLSSLEQRLSPCEDMEIYRLASTLDPRFKLNWCEDSEVSLVRELLSSKATAADPAEPAVVTDSAPPPTKRMKLTSFLSKRQVGLPPVTASSNIHQEVEQYLSQPAIDEDMDPLAFWREHRNQFPTLCKLASKYLSLPASSAPVERLFSIAGKVFRPERCRLTDIKFEEIMMIRCNSK